MTERDCSAIRIDVFRIVRQLQLSKHSQPLRSKSFIQLDDIHVPN